MTKKLTVQADDIERTNPSPLPSSRTSSPSSNDLHEQSSGFTYVARRLDKRARKHRKSRINGVLETIDLETQLEKRKQIVLARKRELQDDAALQQFLDNTFPYELKSAQSSIRTALALGVGSVKDARPAQIQLAFLLLLSERLGISDVRFYDPICDENDYAMLRALSITPLSENRRGRYPVDVDTLLYMPHCTRTLYENMLRANWSIDRLSRVLLCCNTLDRYVGGGSASSHATNVSAPCLQRAVDQHLLYVHPVPTGARNDSVAYSALNDLAVQSFVPLSRFTSAAATSPASSSTATTTHTCSHDGQQSAPCRLFDMDLMFWDLPDDIESSQDVELI